jgi:hypothetical protein
VFRNWTYFIVLCLFLVLFLTSKATSTFFLPDAQRSKYNIITQEVGRMCIGYITLVEENLP